MLNNINTIFQENITLIAKLDKAIYYLRKQQHDIALGIITDSMDQIKDSIEAIIVDKDYFNLVSTDSVIEMLSAVFQALKKEDYILLADLLEMQMVSFLCGVQELIISKEDVGFEEERYLENQKVIKDNSIGLSDILKNPIEPEVFLRDGYRVELTSCGLMTLAAENDDAQFYFHTNGRVYAEAFMVAKHWYTKEAKSYIIYGLGFGYHIEELLQLDEQADITVYEADENIILLACAFTHIKKIFESGKVKLVYDSDYQKLKNKLKKLSSEEVLCIHFPSFQNIRNDEGRKIIGNYLSWSKF